MEEQRVIVTIENRRIQIDYDVESKLSEFRKYLIDRKHIVVDDEGDTWRIARVENGKPTDVAATSLEIYLPIRAFMYDTNKIIVVNLKRSIEVFAGTLHEFVRVDISDSLEDLRKLLISKSFINADQPTSAWRFVSPSAKDLKDVTEAIIGINSEGQIRVRSLLYGRTKVRMVDTNRKKNPDLVGVGVDYFQNGDIDVSIIRNDDLSPKKLAPIMMKNVRPANKHGVVTDFSNVVLCEKETAIGIRISTRSHGGFAYSIKLQEGKDIAEQGLSSHTGWTTYAYQGTRNAIKVVSYKDLDIPTQQAIGHRRMTVKVWRYISFRHSSDRKTRIVDDNAPKKELEVDVVSGFDIEGGVFEEGDDTENYMSKGNDYIYDIVDNPGEILGIFEIDFLVFKTPEAAQNMVESRIDPIFD